MNGKTASEPWYRNPMVWLVIGIPLTSVVLGITMIVLAVSTDDGLVVDDYYWQGKQIGRVIARDQAAAAHGLRARVSLADNRLDVMLTADSGYTLPPAMEVNFFYSTRAGLDKATFVTEQSPGIYSGEILPLEDGRWNVQLEADDWRLLGSLHRPHDSSTLIRPTAAE